FPDGRETPRVAVPEPDGGRAVELAQIDAPLRLVLLLEERHLPVRGDALRERPVEPRQVAFRLFGGGVAHDFPAGRVQRTEHPSIPGDVRQKSPWHAPDLSRLAGERRGEKSIGSRRPDLTPPRGPGESPDRSGAGGDDQLAV